MTLEQQVCSLDLSKRLKALGVKQDSYFDWYDVEITDWDHNGWQLGNQLDMPEEAVRDYCSAFTVAELGEMLRPHFQKSIWLHSEIGVELAKAERMQDEASTRAKLLIYLLENKLISLQEAA